MARLHEAGLEDEDWLKEHMINGHGWGRDQVENADEGENSLQHHSDHQEPQDHFHEEYHEDFQPPYKEPFDERRPVDMGSLGEWTPERNAPVATPGQHSGEEQRSDVMHTLSVLHTAAKDFDEMTPEERAAFKQRREEKGDRWHEFGNQYSEDVHRGIHVALPDDLHDYVHNEDIPRADRANALQQHFSSQGLGMHWTPHVNIANRAIGNAAQAGHGLSGGQLYNSRGSDVTTDVMFHVRKPGQRNRLPAREHEEHEIGWQYGKDENEFPVRPGAPLRLTGISWKEHEPQYPNEPYEHHDFDKPMRHTAGKTAAYYHGNPWKMEPGTLLEPGHEPVISDIPQEHVFFSESPHHAAEWANLATDYARDEGGYNRANPHVYEVEPQGEHEADPLAGPAGLPGDRRTTSPLRIIRERHDLGLMHDLDCPGCNEARNPHTAKVPWTDHQRGQLHSWQDGGPGIAPGDFVPSTNFTNKRPTAIPPPEELLDEEEDVPAGFQAQAVSERAWGFHLRQQHGWTEDEIAMAQSQGEKLGDTHRPRTRSAWPVMSTAVPAVRPRLAGPGARAGAGRPVRPPGEAEGRRPVRPARARRRRPRGPILLGADQPARRGRRPAVLDRKGAPGPVQLAARGGDRAGPGGNGRGAGCPQGCHRLRR